MGNIAFFDSKECEWADMTVYIDGATTSKLEGIRYKSSKAKTALHGSGNKPISIQSGNRTYDGQLKVLLGALKSMNKAAKLAGGDDILDVSITIVVVYQQNPGDQLETDTLIGVEFSDFEIGWDQGADHMEVTLPFLFLDLK